MNLSRYVVLDCTSGTFFNAAHAVLIDVDQIPPELEDKLNEGSDLDRIDVGEAHGQDLEKWSPPEDSQVLDAVAALLTAEDWSSDHLSVVADMVRSTGRTIADLADIS